MDKYTYIVIGLVVAVLAVYFIFIGPVVAPKAVAPPPAPATSTETSVSVPTRQDALALPTGPPIARATPVAAPTPVVPAVPFAEIPLESDKFKAVFTNQGAALVSVTLRDFHSMAEGKAKGEGSRGDEPDLSGDLKVLSDFEPGVSSLVMLPPAKAEGIAVGDFDKENYEYSLPAPAEDGSRQVVFRRTFGQLEVTKTFTLRPGRRDIGVSIETRNVGAEKIVSQYVLRSAAGILPEQPKCPLPGTTNGQLAATTTRTLMAAKAGTGLRLITLGASPSSAGCGCQCSGPPKEFKPYSELPVSWIGIDNVYFAALLAPETRAAVEAVPGPIADGNLTCSLLSRRAELESGQALKDDYLFYVGPKTTEAFKAYAKQDFDFILRPGGMDPIGWVATILGGLLSFFYFLIPNYGVAIILLTIVVRVAMHPLTRSSQRSMYRLQKLQPKIAELREKFKNDKQRMNEETMKLYKESGANPIGGCLPMLLQFPILIGLFRLLQTTFPLRQAPFVFWIDDLSKPDALFCLPFQVPLIGPMLGGAFNVLPILMIVAMVVQTKMTPKSEDPQQRQSQKIMAFMPVFFGVFFYSMASGLTLYWLLSTALGAAEQWYILKKLKEADEAIVSGPQPSGRKQRP